MNNASDKTTYQTTLPLVLNITGMVKTLVSQFVASCYSFLEFYIVLSFHYSIKEGREIPKEQLNS